MDGNSICCWKSSPTAFGSFIFYQVINFNLDMNGEYHFCAWKNIYSCYHKRSAHITKTQILFIFITIINVCRQGCVFAEVLLSLFVNISFNLLLYAESLFRFAQILKIKSTKKILKRKNDWFTCKILLLLHWFASWYANLGIPWYCRSYCNVFGRLIETSNASNY